MSLTRRGFLHQTFVVGPVVMALGIEVDWVHAQGGPDCTLPPPPPAKRFVPNEPKVVTRLSAAEIGAPGKETQLKQFRDAVGIVRNLPDTNVISWTKEIAQHCLNCAPSNTKNVHYNWQFLTWHRAYLYFLERILRTLSTYNDLRLVYWDWENPKSRVLPEIYAPSGQPLFWANRGNLSGPNWPLTDSKVNVQPLLAIRDFSDFGGTATQNAPRPAAYGGPHAQVHNNFSPGDMANLQFSPRDPVFYGHHGNIDRLWTSWVAAGHKNPDFGQDKVFFYDETRTWRFVLMNDLRNESKLGYKYSTLMKPKTPVNQLRQFAFQKVGARFKLPSNAMPKIMAAAPTPTFLLIQNIKSIDRFPQAIEFGIFLGSPAVGVEAASAKGFLGSVAEIRSGEHAHQGPLSAALEVTGKLSDAKDEVDLTIAPLDDAGKTSAAAIPLVADKITLIG
jgi:polyphenol oxidase